MAARSGIPRTRSRGARRLRGIATGLGVAAFLAGCGDDPGASLAPGATVELALTGLRPLDAATEGSYEAWVYGADGAARSLGRFELPADGRVRVELPAVPPRRFAVTLEPPGDVDASPSAAEILGGDVRDGLARLSIVGSVTAGFPLEPEPGAHSLFTTSNNALLGYPSYENAGVWMFSTVPGNNQHGTREVRVTSLRAGWTYEGWIVLRHGMPDAVWISYGKFRPDEYQLLSSRDNTGSGPFSGDEDFRNSGIEDVPGDEWTTPREGLTLPGGLTLPLELDAVDAATDEPLWTHVITIEPAFDEDEPLLGERPFLLQPYWNPIGPGLPHVPRVILFRDALPAGTVRAVG